MKRRRLIWLLLLSALVVGAVLALLSSVPDPLYHGRRASVWAYGLNSTDLRTQMRAQEAILELGPDAVPELSRDVRATGRGKHIRIRTWLSRVGSVLPRRLSRRVNRALGFTGSYYAGSGAAIILGEMGPDARAAIPALIDALDDEDANVRSCAACALVDIAPDDGHVMDVLSRKLFQDKEDWILSNVANQFYRLEASNTAAIPLVQKTLVESTNSNARANAARALGRFTAADGRAAACLTNALTDADPYVCLGAAEGLWRMQHPSGAASGCGKEPLPAMLDQFQAQEPALVEVYPELKRVLPMLEKDMGAPVNWTKLRATAAIWTLTRQKDSIVPTLAQVAQAPDGWTVASLMLAALGAETDPVVPRIAKQISNAKPDDFEVARSGMQILERFGPAARDAAPAVRAAMTNEFASIRLSAARALWRIDPKPDELVPLLIQWLQTGGVYTRSEALEILAEIGPPAKDAAPVIRPLLDNWSERVRRTAAEALASVDATNMRVTNR